MLLLVTKGITFVQIHETSLGVDGLAELFFPQTYDIQTYDATAYCVPDGVEIDQDGILKGQANSFDLAHIDYFAVGFLNL